MYARPTLKTTSMLGSHRRRSVLPRSGCSSARFGFMRTNPPHSFLRRGPSSARPTCAGTSRAGFARAGSGGRRWTMTARPRRAQDTSRAWRTTPSPASQRAASGQRIWRTGLLGSWECRASARRSVKISGARFRASFGGSGSQPVVAILSCCRRRERTAARVSESRGRASAERHAVIPNFDEMAADSLLTTFIYVDASVASVYKDAPQYQWRGQRTDGVVQTKKEELWESCMSGA